ncbi:hypothetical protein E2C01_071518 [Portunus trituberculatus]|uniref:Uncharacterized protein n=1 Tax=Portunus trituberculatus TaxID=210409 RepID=A0A5B7I8F1_PORTR|nr:hypothetical protein [Portunus trituberculatus]
MTPGCVLSQCLDARQHGNTDRDASRRGVKLRVSGVRKDINEGNVVIYVHPLNKSRTSEGKNVG